MSGLKTFFCLLALSLPAPCPALSDISEDPLRLFATCLGRQSAVVEHAWLTGADSAAALRRREAFDMLLAAVLPGDREADIRARDTRIRAKHALARLLQQASFHPDPARRRRAGAQVTATLRPCRALLLS